MIARQITSAMVASAKTNNQIIGVQQHISIIDSSIQVRIESICRLYYNEHNILCKKNTEHHKIIDESVFVKAFKLKPTHSK